jgi:hypothetical protein
LAQSLFVNCCKNRRSSNLASFGFEIWLTLASRGPWWIEQHCESDLVLLRYYDHNTQVIQVSEAKRLKLDLAPLGDRPVAVVAGQVQQGYTIHPTIPGGWGGARGRGLAAAGGGSGGYGGGTAASTGNGASGGSASGGGDAASISLSKPEPTETGTSIQLVGLNVVFSALLPERQFGIVTTRRCELALHLIDGSHVVNVWGYHN